MHGIGKALEDADLWGMGNESRSLHFRVSIFVTLENMKKANLLLRQGKEPSFKEEVEVEEKYNFRRNGGGRGSDH